MYEHINLLGGKKWYGNHLVDLQKEPLDVIQAYCQNFGAFILSGCVTTPNVGTPANFDISAGIVAINHADGFKVVRFVGVTNSPSLGYLTVGKTAISGAYNSGTATIGYNYKADFNAGTLPNYTNFHIPLLQAGEEPQTLVKAMRNHQYTDWVDFVVSQPKVSGTVKMRYDKIGKRLQVQAQTLTIKNMGTWGGDFEPITVISDANLIANAVIGGYYSEYFGTSPLQHCPAHWNGVSFIEDANNVTAITGITAQIDGTGLTVLGVRSAGNTPYVVSMDFSIDFSGF